MKIIEQYSVSKTGNLHDCEDLIFFSDSFASVIDGATSRGDRLFDGKNPGLAAALAVKNAIGKFGHSFSLRKALKCLTEEILLFNKSHGIGPEEYNRMITASAVIYSRYHNRIWLIGDCQCLVNNKTYANANGIDDFTASVRSFVNQAEILKGRPLEWIMENDPGSEYIKPLLVEQFLFQNLNPALKGAFGYTAIDGRNIEERSVKVIDIEKDCNEIILASDGYPAVCKTLNESEEALTAILKSDPLCIYEHKCVKGLKEGLVSYDDRAYLRFAAD